MSELGKHVLTPPELVPSLGFLKEKATRELPLPLLPGLPCPRRGHRFLHLPSSWSQSSDVTQIPCCWEERDTPGNTEPATKRGVPAFCAASEALGVSVCFQKPGAGESQNTDTKMTNCVLSSSCKRLYKGRGQHSAPICAACLNSEGKPHRHVQNLRGQRFAQEGLQIVLEIPIQALKFCLLLLEMLTHGLSIRVSAVLGIRDWGGDRFPNKAIASETHLSPPRAETLEKLRLLYANG